MLLFSDGAAVCFRRLLCFSFQRCIPALKQLLPLTRGNKQPPTPAWFRSSQKLAGRVQRSVYGARRLVKQKKIIIHRRAKVSKGFATPSGK